MHHMQMQGIVSIHIGSLAAIYANAAVNSPIDATAAGSDDPVTFYQEAMHRLVQQHYEGMVAYYEAQERGEV